MATPNDTNAPDTTPRPARLTDEQLDVLAGLEARATHGPWRAGRMDTESYDGNGEGPWKAVYCDDPRGGRHLGRPLPYRIARGEGDECRENAALIAAARTALPSLLSEVRSSRAGAERAPAAEAPAKPPDDAGPKCDACKGRGWIPGDCHPCEVCGTCNGTGYPRSWAAREIDRLDRALSAAREEGRRAGIEEAATMLEGKLCRAPCSCYGCESLMDHASAVRALARGGSHR